MKTKKDKFKIKFSIAIILIVGFLAYSPAKAQVSVNVNISSQCLWGPVGYDYVEYYYLPEVDAFYYVPTGQFIYWEGPRQVFVNHLPSSYNINLYTTYKVVVNSPKPYLHHNAYKTKYGKYKHGGPKQYSIRDSHDAKYFEVNGHLNHNQSNYKSSNNQKSTGNKAIVANSHNNKQTNKQSQLSKGGKGNNNHNGKGH